MLPWAAVVVIFGAAMVLFVVSEFGTNIVGGSADTSSVGGSGNEIVGRASVIDGDTIKDGDDKSIRFALAEAPELSTPEGIQAKEFIESICPIGSSIIIDEDDSQIKGSYDRIIAEITCNGISLNQALIENNHGSIDTRFCSSEFAAESWANDCQ